MTVKRITPESLTSLLVVGPLFDSIRVSVIDIRGSLRRFTASLIPPRAGFSARFRGAGPAVRGTARTAWPRMVGAGSFPGVSGGRSPAFSTSACSLTSVRHAAERNATAPTWAWPSPPGYCANPVTGATGAPVRCGGDLTATAVTRLSDSHPGMTAQRTVYDVIDAGAARFGIYRTQPAPGTRALADIRAVAGRILDSLAAADGAAVDTAVSLMHCLPVFLAL